eukprot:1395525-Pleurochrysis_carterae.AAC.1
MLAHTQARTLTSTYARIHTHAYNTLSCTRVHEATGRIGRVLVPRPHFLAATSLRKLLQVRTSGNCCRSSYCRRYIPPHSSNSVSDYETAVLMTISLREQTCIANVLDQHSKNSRRGRAKSGSKEEQLRA